MNISRAVLKSIRHTGPFIVLLATACAEANLPVEPIANQTRAAVQGSGGFSIDALTMGPNGEIYRQPAARELCGTVWSGADPVFSVQCTTDWIYDPGGGTYYYGGWIDLLTSDGFLATVEADLSKEMHQIGPIPGGVVYLNTTLADPYDCVFGRWDFFDSNGVLMGWSFDPNEIWHAGSGISRYRAFIQCGVGGGGPPGGPPGGNPPCVDC